MKVRILIQHEVEAEIPDGSTLDAAAEIQAELNNDDQSYMDWIAFAPCTSVVVLKAT